eukprot:CAMPEP_0119299054 /NCGR_PEP_ID=MMETSP1333-20130426/1174_1 /TAXON_ID=418940 /ORGANISM="Scyphosphaera apsteinii, Strain RCC1455" /LENGTH=97 /DNA_ID=CAMNT_0007300347 /DNA_START=65 /DNA_END=354 /DNA_ORIENTATION=+
MQQQIQARLQQLIDLQLSQKLDAEFWQQMEFTLDSAILQLAEKAEQRVEAEENSPAPMAAGRQFKRHRTIPWLEVYQPSPLRDAREARRNKNEEMKP